MCLFLKLNFPQEWKEEMLSKVEKGRQAGRAKLP